MRPVPAGSQIGPYVVERALGAGGMGAVYLGRHRESGARHAVKIVSSALLPGSGSANARALSRFQREVETLGRLAPHPGLARVHTCGVEGGAPWCALEYVEGRPLSDLVADDGPMEAEEACRIVVEAARAVEHVHHHRVLHRDIKPENIILDAATGMPKLIDFGLAFVVTAERLTQTGQLLGTPAYMAPEQLSSGDETVPGLSRATDVYGLGGVLYFLVTGRPPFVAREVISLLTQLVKDPPAAPRSLVPTIPPDVDAICLRALAKSPADRYPTAEALASELERWAREGSISGRTRKGTPEARRRASRRRATAGLAVALLVVMMLVALFWLPLGRGPIGETRLRELERALERSGALTADERADALAAASSEAIVGDADLERRAAIVGALATEGDTRARGMLIARLVRPGGEIDEPLLRRVERALVESERAVVLDGALHGVEPVAAASPAAASLLVRVMLAPDAPVTPPRGRTGFRALLRAPGLTERDRGTLHLRRAQLALAEGELEAAFADLAAARLDHGVALGDLERVDELLRHGCEVYLAGARAGDDEAMRSVFDLLAALPIDRAEPPPAELAVALVAAAAEQRDGLALRTAALLEMLGLGLRDPRQGFYLRAIPTAAVQTAGEAEVARLVSRRNVALLAFVATLGENDVPDADRRRWIEAAAETRIDALWWHVALARLDEVLGEEDDAIVRRLELAYERDRSLPVARRRPLVARQLAHHRTFERTSASLRDAARLALEAAEVQRVALDRVDAFAALGGATPWQLDRPALVLETMRIVAMALLQRPADEPCCSKTDELVGVDRLAEVATALTLEPRVQTLKGLSELPVDAWIFAGVAGLHHVRHGRMEDALPGLGEAVDGERNRRPAGREGKVLRRDSLRRWLGIRARILRELGRTAEAERDEREATAVR